MVSANGPILLIPMTPNSSNQKKEGNLYVFYTTLWKMIIDWWSKCLLGLLLVNSILNITEILSFTSPKAYIILWGGFPKFPPPWFPQYFLVHWGSPFWHFAQKAGALFTPFCHFLQLFLQWGPIGKEQRKNSQGSSTHPPVTKIPSSEREVPLPHSFRYLCPLLLGAMTSIYLSGLK